jgi:hypothetical protein
MKTTINWDITPCSLLNVNRRFGGTYSHHQGRRISDARNQEAICSSKTSVDFQQTTWCYIPENGTLHNHSCENLKSYKIYAGHYKYGHLHHLQRYKRGNKKKSTFYNRMLFHYMQQMWQRKYSQTKLALFWSNIKITNIHQALTFKKI